MNCYLWYLISHISFLENLKPVYSPLLIITLQTWMCRFCLSCVLWIGVWIFFLNCLYCCSCICMWKTVYSFKWGIYNYYCIFFNSYHAAYMHLRLKFYHLSPWNCCHLNIAPQLINRDKLYEHEINNTTHRNLGERRHVNSIEVEYTEWNGNILNCLL